MVASAALSSVAREEVLGMRVPLARRKVTSWTRKGIVLVLVDRGLVYSPTRSR